MVVREIPRTPCSVAVDASKRAAGRPVGGEPPSVADQLERLAAQGAPDAVKDDHGPVTTRC